MTNKKVSMVCIALCVCFFINSIVLPQNVYAENRKNATVEDITTIEDYTKEYGLSKNEDIRPLAQKNTDESVNYANSSSTTDIKYMAILVEFPDENMESIHLDDENAREAGEMIARTGGKVISSDGEKDILPINEYFERYSYGKLNVDVQYFPKNSQGQVISYVTKNNRTYYMRKTASNPDGFTNENRVERETELLNEVVQSVKQTLEQNYTVSQLDTNNDGYLDAINFFVESAFLDRNIQRGDILWSHKADNLLPTKIHGLHVGRYNVVNASDPSSPGGVFSYQKNTTNGEVKLNRANYSVIIHEFLHTLGIYDLYREGEGDPVGIYDIMAYNHPTNPQPVLTINSRGALGWGQAIPTFKPNETVKIYRPKYISDTEKTSYKIISDLNDKEFFVVEYYDKPEGILNSGREDGLIIYRVRDDVFNNLGGSISTPEKDHVYVFRPNETVLGEANNQSIKDAVISPTVGTRYGKSLEETAGVWDKDSIYFSDGRNSGIKLEIVEATDEYISVRYTAPEVNGSGTASDPYLISNVAEWNNYVRSNNYVRLTQNIDFAGYTLKSKELMSAHIDGNGKTISNINIEDGNGLFESLINSTLKNLTIDNITVTGEENGHAGALAGSFSGGEIDNVNILSGSVVGGNSMQYDFQGVGGFIGTISSGTIKNSSTKVNVSQGRYIGAFIGLSQGGIIQNNSASGVVTATSNEKAGGFYGDSLKLPGMAELDATYVDNFFEITNENLKNANYSGNKEGIYGIYMKPKVSIDLSVKDTEKLEVMSYGTKDIPINLINSKIENPDIATLSGNDIKGLKAGNTTFSTRVSLGNGGLDLTRPIEVIGPNKQDKPLISITLNPKQVELNVGKTSNISVSYNPQDTTDNKSVIWKSDNPNIATVKNGVITAVSKGNAKITATVGSKSASVSVIVKLPSTGMELNTGNFTLNKGANKTINAKLLPVGTTDNAKITWTSSNEKVALIKDGAVTAVGKGTATIKVIATVGEKKYEKNITVTVNPSKISRLGGSTRYETAAIINNKMKSDTLILVTGKDFADALSATALVKHHNGEIHLVNNDLDSNTMASLNRGEFNKAIIVGGTGAVSQSVENKVKNILGKNNVKRFGGKTRYETSSMVVASISTNAPAGTEKYPYAFAVTGKNFADALSVAPIAAMTGSPIVLTEGTSISGAGASALLRATKGYYKIGGQAVVGNGIDKVIGTSYKRLSGANRYETNKAIISEFNGLFTGDSIYVATGVNFPDSLSGSALAGKNKSPIVFVNSVADQSTKKLVDKLNKPNLIALGGTGVVSNAIMNELNK